MRILYISYFYPPLGGPAALRNQKMVRYLADLGAEIHMISVDEIEYAYRDEKLCEQCRETNITRTPSLDPMALLKRLFKGRKDKSQAIYKNTPERFKLLLRRLYPLDDKVGWLPYLLKAGRELLASQDFDLIYVSCGPFSSAIGAYLLAKRHDLPLVVDYRDYWTLLSDYDLMGNRLKLATSRAWERRILQSASLLICATKGIADDLAEHFGKALYDKSMIIYNGHDEEDYQSLEPARPSAQYFTFSYFGNIYARRSLKHFYEAVEELSREALMPERTRIRLYGSFNREVIQEIDCSGIKPMIEVMPQLSHQEALFEMQKADVLLLVINSSSPRGTLTSKVFEYLRIGRPILAMVPQWGEAADLLRECGVDTICPMESVSAIKSCLLRILEEPVKESIVASELSKYERGFQVEKLYQRLKKLDTNAKCDLAGDNHLS